MAGEGRERDMISVTMLNLHVNEEGVYAEHFVDRPDKCITVS